MFEDVLNSKSLIHAPDREYATAGPTNLPTNQPPDRLPGDSYKPQNFVSGGYYANKAMVFRTKCKTILIKLV
jgi:hypothetical protein